MFVNVGVPTCSAVLRNLMYRFMCRASESVNDVIAVITNPIQSSVRFSSCQLCTCLFVQNCTWWKSLYCTSFSVYLFIILCFYCDMDLPVFEIKIELN